MDGIDSPRSALTESEWVVTAFRALDPPSKYGIHPIAVVARV